MNKAISRITVMILSAAMVFGGAPCLSEVLGVSAYAQDEQGWEKAWDYNKCSDMSISEAVYHGESGYSVVLTNDDYNVSVAAKTFSVERDTKYRFSAWVKYENCTLSPNATGTSAGARIGLAVVGYGEGCYNGSQWKELTFEFDSGDSDSVRLGLYNGLGNAECRGTAYFSDIRLEPVYPWDSTYQYRKDSAVKFSVDKNETHDNAEYSIKITNDNYNVSYAAKTFEVKKDAKYKVSAWVKCSGYQLEENRADNSGACISIAGNTVDSKYTQARSAAVRYSGSKWEKLEFEFDSGNSTSYDIAFYNGMWYSDCKGTVYFSDIQIEEVFPWDAAHEAYRGRTEFSVDKTRASGDGDYSIKIVNNEYNLSYVAKTFEVKKNTHYRASVMAKCSGYELEPGRTTDSGAGIGPAESGGIYHCSTSTTWKRLYYEFDSGDSTQYTVALYNGMWARDCKGTVWFSDFKLEEYGEPETDWNVLVVFFKNIDAPVKLDEKKQNFKCSLNKADVAYLKTIFERMYTSLPTLSEGLWSINSMDFYADDSTVKELRYDEIRDGYSLEPNSPSVSKVLDKYIDKAEKQCGKKYDQIIAVSPLTDISHYWLGLGGTSYNDIRFAQINYKSGTESFSNPTNYYEAAIVHEMLHCAEAFSRDIWKLPTLALHSNVDKESYTKYYTREMKGWAEWGAYHSDYIRCATPDGQGVDRHGFYVFRNGTVVYGKPFTTTYKKADISQAVISEISDRAYTGKKVKPAVTVKLDGKTLTAGKDYTVKYLNNTDIGTAAVVVQGKGKYFGNVAESFKITPAKTKLSVKKSGGKYTLSWGRASGAEKYEIYYSTDKGKTFKLLKTVDGSRSSVTVSLKAGKKYSFKVRSYCEIYPMHFNSSFSNIVKA